VGLEITFSGAESVVFRVFLVQRAAARMVARNCAVKSSAVVAPQKTAAVPPARITSTSVIPIKARMRLR
jgi:hypothetical protein